MAKRPKYKSKEVTEAGNVMYRYSAQQVARRDNEKAGQVGKLDRRIGKIRSRISTDLKSRDRRLSQHALAAMLLLETGIRPGNAKSAKDGHYGLLYLLPRHLKGDRLIYVGKDGVKQNKKLPAGCAKRLRRHDRRGVRMLAPVTPSSLRAYVEKWGVRPKDFRQARANSLMAKRLKSARRNAPRSLPNKLKDRKKTLQPGFQKALEQTAAEMGHKPATLRSAYLVPGMADEYLRSGKVKKP
jgi:DNA topoisomerase IB